MGRGTRTSSKSPDQQPIRSEGGESICRQLVREPAADTARPWYENFYSRVSCSGSGRIS